MSDKKHASCPTYCGKPCDLVEPRECVRSFAFVTPDFEKFRPAIYRHSLLPENATLHSWELYNVAKYGE